MYQLYDKNRDRPGTGAKPVKAASFFHQDRLFFCQKQLAKPLETRVYSPRRPGCGRGADLGLREAFAGVWGCLSAVLDVVFMPCFCIFSGEKGRFIFKRLRFVDGYYLNILLDSLLTH